MILRTILSLAPVGNHPDGGTPLELAPTRVTSAVDAGWSAFYRIPWDTSQLVEDPEDLLLLAITMADNEEVPMDTEE